MPSRVSNGAQGVTPVLVEVKPRNAASSTPSPPSSPKAVRFAPSSAQGISRPLTNKEEWSLWHFEHHATKCRDCYDPYMVFKHGYRLCPDGHALAQDVALNVFYKNGDIWSAYKDVGKYVRVEVKPGYWHTEGLLRGLDRHARHMAQRPRAVVDYDPDKPRSARFQPERRETVIIEPATSRPERRASHKSRHPPKRYDTIVVDDDVEAAVRPSSSSSKYKERRGSLYDAEMARLDREKRYRVQVREPERRRRDRDRDDRRRERYE